MSRVNELIEETRKNCEDLATQVEEYKLKLQELLIEFKSRGRIVNFSYYPYSHDGRKVCFGLIGFKDTKEYNTMISDLLLNKEMEDFLIHLTQKVIPLHKLNETSLPNFYF